MVIELETSILGIRKRTEPTNLDILYGPARALEGGFNLRNIDNVSVASSETLRLGEHTTLKGKAINEAGVKLKGQLPGVTKRFVHRP